jgi:PIN domain nuclease of toxin-antitoxin system
MRLLLDTHIFLALIDPGVANLSAAAVAALSDPAAEHFLSAASLWEIAIKTRLGKLKLTTRLETLPELFDGLGVGILSINDHHALASVEPEPATRDPFDRMLLAQCRVEGLRLLTMDRALVSHPFAATV